MSTEASPHQTQHLHSSYPHHPASMPSNEPPRMSNPAPSLPDAANGSHSFTGDLSMSSMKTEDSMSDNSAVAGQPSQPSKGKNGATGPAEGKAKPHVCPICQRGFTTGGHLQRHHRIHTGVKAFKCPFPGCETRTSRQDNLQQHYRTHLSPTLRRGSGSAARAAVNAAMEAAGLKSSSSRQPRKSKSGTGTPTSATASHFPSPYATNPGPNPYAAYMYDQQHGYPPPYPIPPGVAMTQPQSATSSRVPSPVNGHSATGSLPPAHQQSFFSQPYTPTYASYPSVHQQPPYRYPTGGIPYPAGPYSHHSLYSSSIAPEHSQHMYSPMQSSFAGHSREGSYGLSASAYGGRSPTSGAYGHARR
ncbi:hypothetical protein I308_106594 [Cryptococcus tetragattii IND107]|uniref:C2H2-type domain-containing protein n=1 Tax=Cryptococcus tetragattii IND107 TaxID=1296105 RepID=A0ABR3BJ75_9TREE|nr:transcriptional regulator Nrg1 [Cryptococcus tetragattii IND107]